MTTQNPSLPNENVPLTHTSWRRFLRALLSRSPVSGQATFSAGTNVAVTLNPPLLDDQYNVLVDAPENNTFWATNKTPNGFTLNASSSTSVTVGYTTARR